MRHPRLLFALWTLAVASVFLFTGIQSATPPPPALSNPDGAALDALIHQIATDTVYANTNDCGALATIGMQRLQKAGYLARRINVVTLETRDGATDGHILNEVFNPQSAAWEVVDFSTDRRYQQTAWAFVQQRSTFTPLTTDRITAPTFTDEYGIFAQPERFYDRVAQAVAIEYGDYWWFGDSAHRALIERYGYVYDPAFLTRFYT
jgi:hypothetical protein